MPGARKSHGASVFWFASRTRLRSWTAWDAPVTVKKSGKRAGRPLSSEAGPEFAPYL